ncbi:MAG: hypothetical protein Q4G68_05475 [Planctomycetia bacterium]|nr:hypothetical protein [Planctomycetia bacterium]
MSMLSKWFKSEKKSSLQKGIKRNRKSGLAIEPLEERQLLSVSPNTPTGFAIGSDISRINDAEIGTRLTFDFFEEKAVGVNSAAIGFVVTANDDVLDPGKIELKQGDATLTPITSLLNYNGTKSSLAIFSLTPGSYDVFVSSEQGTTGSFTCEVYLPGDTNGDGLVSGTEYAADANAVSLLQERANATHVTTFELALWEAKAKAFFGTSYATFLNNVNAGKYDLNADGVTNAADTNHVAKVNKAATDQLVKTDPLNSFNNDDVAKLVADQDAPAVTDPIDVEDAFFVGNGEIGTAGEYYVKDFDTAGTLGISDASNVTSVKVAEGVTPAMWVELTNTQDDNYDDRYPCTFTFNDTTGKWEAAPSLENLLRAAKNLNPEADIPAGDYTLNIKMVDEYGNEGTVVKTIHYVPNSAVPTINLATEYNKLGGEKTGLAGTPIEVGTDTSFFVQLDADATAYFKAVTNGVCTVEHAVNGAVYTATANYTLTSDGKLAVTIVNDSFSYLTVDSDKLANEAILELPVEVTDLFNAKKEDGTWANGNYKVKLDPVNDLPTATDDSGATDQNSSVGISVLVNDLDNDQWDTLGITKVGADADSLVGIADTAQEITVTTGSGKEVTIKVTKQAITGGTTSKYPGDQIISHALTIDPNGQFAYLKAGDTDTFTFAYEMTDAQGEKKSTASVTVTVTGINDAPTAKDWPGESGAVYVLENNTLAMDLTDYVGDVDQEASLTVVVDTTADVEYTARTWGTDTDSAYQTRIDNLNAKLAGLTLSEYLTFAPTPWQPSSDTQLFATFNPINPSTGENDFAFIGNGESVVLVYTYRVTDEEGAYATATLTFSVEGVNNQPTTTDLTLNITDVTPKANAGVALNLTNDPANTDVSDKDVNDILYVVAGSITYQNIAVSPGVTLSDLPDGKTFRDALSWDSGANKFFFNPAFATVTDELGNSYNYFEQLPEDATATLTYTYKIMDNNTGAGNAVSEEKTITVTITGTNQIPAAENVDVSDATTTDENTELVVMLVDSDFDSPVYHVDDIDKNDVLTVKIDEGGTAEFTKINMESFDLDKFALENALKKMLQDEGKQLSDFIEVEGTTVTFNPLREEDGTSYFDFLGADESMVVTYDYTVSDNKGGTSESKTLKIKVNGVNNQPKIAETLLTIALNDTYSRGEVDFTIENSDTNLDTTDKDVNDSLSLTAQPEYQGITYSQEGFTLDFPTEVEDAIKNALKYEYGDEDEDEDNMFVFNHGALKKVKTNVNGSTVDYYFFEQLPVGVTATLTYTFTIQDDSDDPNTSISAEKTITVTITGTNQTPVAEHVGVTDTPPTTKENNPLNVKLVDSESDPPVYHVDDIDKNDELTVSIAEGGVVAVGDIVAADDDAIAKVRAALDSMLLDEGKQLSNFIEVNGTTVTFNPINPNTETSYFDFLGEGESMVITYNYTVRDKDETSEQKMLKIKVDGVNNQPSAEAGTDPYNATLGAETTLELADVSDTNVVSVSDADVNDNEHTFVQVKTNGPAADGGWEDIPATGSVAVYDTAGHLLGTVKYGTDENDLVFTPDETGDWLKSQCSDVEAVTVSFDIKISDNKGQEDSSVSEAATLTFSVLGNHLNPVIDAGQTINMKAAGTDLNGDKAVTAQFSPGYIADTATGSGWQIVGTDVVIGGATVANTWFQIDSATGEISFISADLQEAFKNAYLTSDTSIDVTMTLQVTDMKQSDRTVGLISGKETVTLHVVKKDSPVVEVLAPVIDTGGENDAELAFDLQIYFTVSTPDDETSTPHTIDKPWYKFDKFAVDSANSSVGTTSFDAFIGFPISKEDFYRRIVDAISISASGPDSMTASMFTLDLSDDTTGGYGKLFAFLAEGDTLTLALNGEVVDQEFGVSTPVSFSVTINGANDKPEVTNPGWTVPLAQVNDNEVVNPTAILPKYGNFTDPDWSDSHSLSSITFTGGTIGGEAKSVEEFAAYFGLTQEDLEKCLVANEDDNLRYTFDVDYVKEGVKVFQKLPLGTNAVLNYTFKITDNHENSESLGEIQGTVTITGTNQDPVAENVTTVVTTDQNTPVDIIINGVKDGVVVKHVSDIDTGDTQKLSLASGVDVAYTAFSTKSETAVDTLESHLATMDLAHYVSFSGSTLDDLMATFYPGTDFAFIGVGESVTLTYQWKSTDNNGGESENATTFMVTITGLNDQPEVTEGGNIEIEIGDSIVGVNYGMDLTYVASDADINDTLSMFTDENNIIAMTGNVVYSADYGLADRPSGIDSAMTWDADDSRFNFNLRDVTYTDALGITQYYFKQLPEGATATITYQYQVTDDSGALDAKSESRTVTVIITGTNQAPESRDDYAKTLDIDLREIDPTSDPTLDLVKHKDVGTDETVVDIADIDVGDTLTFDLVSTDVSVFGMTLSDGTITISSVGELKVDYNKLTRDFAKLQKDIPATITVNFTVTDSKNESIAKSATIMITGKNEDPKFTDSMTLTTGLDLATETSVKIDWQALVTDVDEVPYKDNLYVKSVNGEEVDVKEPNQSQDIEIFAADDVDRTTPLGFVRIEARKVDGDGPCVITMTYYATRYRDNDDTVVDALRWPLAAGEQKVVSFDFTVEDEFEGFTAAKPVEVTVTGKFDVLVFDQIPIADQEVYAQAEEDVDGYIKVTDSIGFHYDKGQSYTFSIVGATGYTFNADDFKVVNNELTEKGGYGTATLYVLKSAMTRSDNPLAVGEHNLIIRGTNSDTTHLNTVDNSFNLTVKDKGALTVPDIDLTITDPISESELSTDPEEDGTYNPVLTHNLSQAELSIDGEEVLSYTVSAGVTLTGSEGTYTLNELASVYLSGDESYADYLQYDFALIEGDVGEQFFKVYNWADITNSYGELVSDLNFMAAGEYLELTYQYTIDSYTTASGKYIVNSVGNITIRFEGTNDQPYGQTATHDSLSENPEEVVIVPATGKQTLAVTDLDQLPWGDYDGSFLEGTGPDEDINYNKIYVKNAAGEYVLLGDEANKVAIKDGNTDESGLIYVWGNYDAGKLVSLGFDSSERFATLAKDTTANVTIYLQAFDKSETSTPLDTDPDYSNLSSQITLQVTGTYEVPEFTGTIANASADVKGYSTDANSQIVINLADNFNVDGDWSLIFVKDGTEVVLNGDNLTANCAWLKSFTFAPGVAGAPGTLTLQLMDQADYKETMDLSALNLKIKLTDDYELSAESNVFEIACNQQYTVEILAMFTDQTADGFYPGTELEGPEGYVNYITSDEFDTRATSTELFAADQDVFMELWFRDNLAKYFGETGAALCSQGFNQIQLQVNCAPVVDNSGNVLSGITNATTRKSKVTGIGYPTDLASSAGALTLNYTTINGVNYVSSITFALTYNDGVWSGINKGCDGNAALLARLLVEYTGDLAENPISITVGPVASGQTTTAGYQYRRLNSPANYTNNSQIQSLDKVWKYATTPVSGTTVTERITNGGIYVRTATERSTSSVVSELPVNATYINEWQTHYGEIWVKATDIAKLTDVAVTFSYNPEYFAATSVEFDGLFDGFYSIDYETGNVSVYASAESAIDTDGFVLVGRVVMQAEDVLSEDGTVLASPQGVVWTDCNDPHALGWELSDGFITTADRGSNKAYTGNTTSTELWGVAYDTNDDGIINTDDIANLALFYGKSSLEGDTMLMLLDLDRSGIINTDDIANVALMYGYRKSAVAKGERTIFFPETFNQRYVGSTLNTDGDVAWVGTVLDTANEQWKESLGLDKGVEVNLIVKDLGSDDLAITHATAVDESGHVTKGIIYLDDDALGATWYAQLDAGVVGSTKYDLYTVLLHELGHLYGYEGHSDVATDVMYADLMPGERKSLTTNDIALGVVASPAALPVATETKGTPAGQADTAATESEEFDPNILVAALLEQEGTSGVRVAAAALPKLNAMGLNIPNAEIVPDAGAASDAAVLALLNESGEEDEEEIDLLDFVSDDDAREIELSIDTLLTDAAL